MPVNDWLSAPHLIEACGRKDAPAELRADNKILLRSGRGEIVDADIGKRWRC